MKLILHKKGFPKAPEGDRYEWKTAETKFVVPKAGKYVIEITALAKNAIQNKSKDDDDLRVALNSFEFGKYEVHDEKVSWKGFGTASPEEGDEVNFKNRDLSKALHGIKSIEYQAVQKKEAVFTIKFTLHDIYDFDYKNYSDIDFGYSYITTFLNNLANRGEDLGVVNNFNIQIKMEAIINLNK